nr:T9SS type A sorting domain-containing protein [Bacteroidota bacterium]
GPWGSEASLPELVSGGTTYDYQYNYIIPEELDEKNLRLIGLIQKYDTDSSKCEILNAKDIFLDLISFVPADDSTFMNLNIYPNPANEILIIELANFDNDTGIEIMDIRGKLYFESASGYRTNSIDVSGYPKGIYFVVLQNEGLLITHKVILK